MGQIKSALELALERTKDIKGDREGLEAKEFKEIGMRLVSKVESEEAIDLGKELSQYTDKKLSWVREGMRQVLQNYLGLPATKEAAGRFLRVKSAIVALGSKPKDLTQLVGQIAQYNEQFLEQRDQLVTAVRQQLEPSIRQKEDSVYQQTGRRVRVSVETDPEFSKFLNANLDKLQDQYDKALAPLREQIIQMMS